jgi:hypothetical protein
MPANLLRFVGVGWLRLDCRDLVIRRSVIHDRSGLEASNHAAIGFSSPIDFSKIAQIDLERLAQEFRFQRIAFTAARDVFDQMQRDWKGSKEVLLAQLVRLAEQFIQADKITITPALFYQDQIKRRLNPMN